MCELRQGRSSGGEEKTYDEPRADITYKLQECQPPGATVTPKTSACVAGLGIHIWRGAVRSA